jgi:crotonobetainyl-CoA:carnitine CoA-transferase CaiB-like acyl-CoA transferase
MTRGLAELGASVMRVTASHITDMSNLHIDLSWGKWNCHLDFRKEEDREKLRALVLEADVVVQGYRPDVLNKYGFGMDDLLKMTEDRGRGLIVVRENCYGWHGPWAYRSGWQQISDACCGVSIEFGRAMGNGEPVTPVFPNSDFCTGTSGTIAVLNALLRRGEKGGSYKVGVSARFTFSTSCGHQVADKHRLPSTTIPNGLSIALASIPSQYGKTFGHAMVVMYSGITTIWHTLFLDSCK